MKIVRDLKLASNEKSFIYIPTTDEIRSESQAKQSEPSPVNKVDSPTRTPGKRAKLSDLSPSRASVKSQESIQEPVEDILPEEIHTSLFLQSNNTDYKIVIRPPSVEYSIPAKNFLFMKTLTRSEVNDYFNDRFLSWT